MTAGHIRQRSAGSWEIRYRDGGKTATETIRTTSKRKAQERLRELMLAVDQGAKAAPSRESCEAWFRRWLAGLDPDLSPMTVKSYRWHVEKYLIPLFGAARLMELDRPMIRAKWATLTLARSSKNLVHRILSASLGQAVEDGVLRHNPAVGWRRDKKKAADHERPEQAILTAAEALRLIEAVRDTATFAPVVLALGTGARRGEIAALTWGRISFDAGYVTIRDAMKQPTPADIRIGSTKTGKPRVVKLPTSYLALIREWKRRQAEELLLLGIRQSGETPVCTRADGRRLTPNKITYLFTAAAKQIGRPDVHFHSLRHTHASLLLAAGEPISSVQKRLGHGQASTTLDVYGHHIPRDDEGEADRLDAALRK